MSISVKVTWHNPNPETIYNKMAARLGRLPTNAEAAAEIKRILTEARANAGRGK